MKYVIMADGRGSRWHNFMGHGKHGILIGGETLLERTVRLVHAADSEAEIIITSHDKSLAVSGASRYEPKNNVLEIDRFTAELIGDDMCFLYGDVLYSEQAIGAIVAARGSAPLLFFGSRDSICAVLVGDGDAFRALYLEARRQYLAGETAECKGWQIYHLFAGLPAEGRALGRGYVLLDSFTRDFNSPEDYLEWLSEKQV